VGDKIDVQCTGDMIIINKIEDYKTSEEDGKTNIKKDLVALDAAVFFSFSLNMLPECQFHEKVSDIYIVNQEKRSDE